MARPLRFELISEGDYYHITARGSGRRNIFEDDADREHYLHHLFSLVDDSTGSLVAWCLMSNHVHILFHMEIHELSALMHRLHTAHAQYFNGRHGHVGPVFQGRFDTSPINRDEHLLLTVKYIHKNPVDIGGVDWKTYPWSSYRGYTDGPSYCETETILDLLGGSEGFKQFHESDDEIHQVRMDGYRRRLSDAEAVQVLKQTLGAQYADVLASLAQDERNRNILVLYSRGLSARQIERLTGIGRNITQKIINGKLL